MTRHIKWAGRALALTAGLTISSLTLAQDIYSPGAVVEEPSALAMTTDALVVRPLMLGVTAVTSVVWLVSLPFAAAGGNVDQTTQTLVVKPALTTFVRCLGCTQVGYRKKDEVTE